MKVERIIIHPEYDDNRLTNDFAIIRTVENIGFSAFANAVCLPSFTDSSITDGHALTVSGWGFFKKDFDLRQDKAETVLYTAQMHGYPIEECCNSWSNSEYLGLDKSLPTPV